MDRFDDGVRRGRQEAVDEVWTGYRLRFRTTVASELSPDSGERTKRTVLIERKPDNVFLLCLRIRFRRIFREAIQRDKAPIFWFQPTSPVR